MSSENLWTVACVQMDVQLGQPEKNTPTIIDQLEQAARKGARLIVFPECAITGYSFASRQQALAVATPLDSPHIQAIQKACARLNVFAVVGTAEKDGETLYNTAVLLGPSGMVDRYRKTHLPWMGLDRFTTAGTEPYRVVDLGGLRVGMLICYDGSFPETCRALTLLGADLVVLPTNWPEGAICVVKLLVAARSLENHIFHAVCNRVGEEGGFHFLGRSRIANPGGEYIAISEDDQPSILVASIDAAQARNKHLVRVPGQHEISRLADRRPDLYGPITNPGLVPAKPQTWIPPG
ncbi:MAG: carbon-nitrogen hydrolase family protein [Gemmataceae bacterium]